MGPGSHTKSGFVHRAPDSRIYAACRRMLYIVSNDLLGRPDDGFTVRRKTYNGQVGSWVAPAHGVSLRRTGLNTRIYMLYINRIPPARGPIQASGEGTDYTIHFCHPFDARSDTHK